MNFFRNSMTALLMLMLIVLLSACSGGSAPVTPVADSVDVPDSFGTTAENGRSLISAYLVEIDPVAETFEISPADRIGAYHLPLSDLYSVVSVTWYSFGPPFEADIKLTHPFPGSGIDAFDARVIAVLPANAGVSMNYPGLDVLANNSVLLEPDGYTDLWDKAFTGNVNPFVAYFKEEANRVWSSTGTTTETQRWTMDLAGFGGPLSFYLVCDVCTNYPAPPNPGDDNCPEPAEIVDVNIGPGLNSTVDSSATIDVVVLDWQGIDPEIQVIHEIPDLHTGLFTFNYSGPGMNPNEYVFSGLVINELGAPDGDYMGLIAAKDSATGRVIYEEFPLTIRTSQPGFWNIDPDRGNVDISLWTYPGVAGTDIGVVNGPDENYNGVLLYDEFHQVLKADIELTASVFQGTAILPNNQDPENPHPNPTEPMQAGRIDASDNGEVIRTFIDGHIGLGPANNGYYQRCDSLVYIQHQREGSLSWTVSFFVGTPDNANTEEIDESLEKVQAIEVWDEADEGLQEWSLGQFWAGTEFMDETSTYYIIAVYGALKYPYYDFVDLYYDWGLFMTTGIPASELKGSDTSNGIFPWHYRAYSGPGSGPAVVYYHMKDTPDYVDEYWPQSTTANLVDFELIPLQDPPLNVNGIIQYNDWGAILLDDGTIEIFDGMNQSDKFVASIDISGIIGTPVHMDIDDSNADIFISHMDGSTPYISVYTLDK